MAVVVVLAGCLSALAASTSKMVVEVPSHPSPAGAVRITFTPRRALPEGGYYYAVLVLAKHDAKRFASRRCARESDMQYNEYGYPGPGKPVSLTIGPEKLQPTPEKIETREWCAGASYRGAIYAVPHDKPCRRSEPCYGHSTAPECYPGESLCLGGKQLHGRVAKKGCAANPDSYQNHATTPHASSRTSAYGSQNTKQPAPRRI